MYKRQVYGSRRKFNQIVSNKNGIRAYINNIYSIGDYFFLDYTLKNKTRIAYDIEEIRVKLTDKKETKATNSQTIEPVSYTHLALVRKAAVRLLWRQLETGEVGG